MFYRQICIKSFFFVITDSRKPICLPVTRELQSRSLAGLNGVVAGWGVTEDGLQSPVLLSVELPILTQSACEETYNGLVVMTCFN